MKTIYIRLMVKFIFLFSFSTSLFAQGTYLLDGKSSFGFARAFGFISGASSSFNVVGVNIKGELDINFGKGNAKFKTSSDEYELEPGAKSTMVSFSFYPTKPDTSKGSFFTSISLHASKTIIERKYSSRSFESHDFGIEIFPTFSQTTFHPYRRILTSPSIGATINTTDASINFHFSLNLGFCVEIQENMLLIFEGGLGSLLGAGNKDFGPILGISVGTLFLIH
ncbi:MAG: hypothetical protein ISR83_08095 [Candidatus Marinimicrobia bacterium]|nr:hypothetical protein [Candidatus Neomarinimicrobiota bacterium]